MKTYYLYKLFVWCCFAPSISALGGDSFLAREDAEALLTRYGDITWPLLHTWAHASSSLEQRRRAHRILQTTLRLESHCPPIALLSGRPMTEWAMPESSYGVIGARPGSEWRLAWLRPDQRAPLAVVVHHYGERARSQYAWRDWHSDADGRLATRLLYTDLLAMGVPATAVRALQDHLNAREQHLSEVVRPTVPGQRRE